MAPLVTVENDRNGGVQGLIHTRENKRHLQGLVQLPGHHNREYQSTIATRYIQPRRRRM